MYGLGYLQVDKGISYMIYFIKIKTANKIHNDE